METTSDSAPLLTDGGSIYERIRNRRRGGWGYWGWQPEKLQWLLGPMPFMFFMGTYCTVYSLVTAGYTQAVLSTVEKRYGLHSTEGGLILSAADIGSLIVVVFISYFGGNSHRPQWIASGAVLAGISVILFSLPQWLSDPYAPSTSTLANSESIPGAISDQLCQLNKTVRGSSKYQGGRTDKSSVYFIIIFLCNFMQGVGGCPIFTLGTSFLFENTPKQQSSLYVGALYLGGAVGPALGYVLCGVILKTYVEPWRTPPMDSNSTQWIGAWWLGYLIFGGMVILSALPLFAYPRRLPRTPEITKKERDGRPPPAVSHSSSARRAIANAELTTSGGVEGDEALLDASSMEYENDDELEHADVDDTESVDTAFSMSFGNLRDLPITAYRLISNPIFLFVTLCAVCEFNIVSAFMNFIPRYVQAQFGIGASGAAITCGMVLVPAAGAGLLIGSTIVSKWNLDRTGCVRMAFFGTCLAILLFIPCWLVKCNNAHIVGVNVPYSNGTIQRTSFTDFGTHLKDINNKCNQNCHCGKPTFEPVCWKEKDYTFFNPCHAGCQLAEPVNKTTKKQILTMSDPYDFYKCGCVPNSLNTDSIKLFQGTCPRKGCHLWLFMVALFFVVAATTFGQTPALIATLNSVSKEDRPMALGVQFLFYRAFAYIPAPIYFGNALDHACLIREDSQKGQGGACSLYDAGKMRNMYFGLLILIKFVGITMVFVAWQYAKKRDRVEADEIRRDSLRHQRFNDTVTINADPEQSSRAALDNIPEEASSDVRN